MSDKIVVIHPGSLYLRIGKACDLNPEMILNCIARKRNSKTGNVHHDPLLPPKVDKQVKQLSAEMDEARISVSHMLQSSICSAGRKRQGCSSNLLAQFNKRSTPEIISSSQQTHWLMPKNNSCIVGADVLRLNPNANYNIHFPIRRGEFNIHSNVDGSLTATLEHIRCIWEFAIKNFLDIELKDLNEYKAVLIISDIYNRKRIKLMAEMLFDMGFKAIILS